jgi:hypothetical protein
VQSYLIPCKLILPKADACYKKQNPSTRRGFAAGEELPALPSKTTTENALVVYGLSNNYSFTIF